MPPRIDELDWSADIPPKLGRRGLTTDDAQDVLQIRPLLAWQKEEWKLGDDGRPRLRPRRVRMIGPDYSGRFLTFILEAPDDHRVSRIVSGWPATRRDIARYRRAR